MGNGPGVRAEGRPRPVCFFLHGIGFRFPEMNESTSSPVRLSAFAEGLCPETAFDVLAVAKQLRAQGKDVIELQIGDSPFPSTKSAVAAGKAAIDAGRTQYCPSLGLPEFRAAAARLVRAEFGTPAAAENVVAAP